MSKGWRKNTGTGTRVHTKGYLQITRRGPWRGWMVHRKVMLDALKESGFWKWHPEVREGRIPEGFTVEHLDHKRDHNCIENLMLLDKRIHDWISTDHGLFMARVRGTVWEAEEEYPEPEWARDVEIQTVSEREEQIV